MSLPDSDVISRIESRMESPDFDASHFPDCATITDEYAVCGCDEIERDLRAEHAANSREW